MAAAVTELSNQPAADVTGLVPSTDNQAEAPPDPTKQFGDWNQSLPQDLQKVLTGLVDWAQDEFRYSRRLQIMDCWRKRSFWREMQHLTWNWDGQCWDALGPAGYTQGADIKKLGAVMYTTNIFQGFGEAFIAILTQTVPNLRFEPEDVEEAADVQTVQHAEPARKIIEHENDPIKLLTKAAYYAWTDGLMCGWTRLEIDKRTNKPRVMQSVQGAMECKTPVIYEELCEYPYFLYSGEYHLSTVREKVMKRNFPDADYWKKIKGGTAGAKGQSEYERVARISIKQGISIKSAGGDAYSHLVTTTRAWMRPSVLFNDDIADEKRVALQPLFPDGIYVEVDNGVYTGSRNASMDDEWTVENIMEGDGSYRNSKGSCLVSVQERANDTMNVTQDTYEKCQPATYYNEKVIDVDAMTEQGSIPGAKYGVNFDDLPEGQGIGEQFAQEPAATVSADMLQYTKELMTEVAEFLTGISAVLFGADQSGDKSGKALSIQQSAAMGRIGLSFRVLKRFYAGMVEQAVRCMARNQQSDYAVGIPDQSGEIETIAVRMGDLNGNIRCYPDSDENYPESWVAKRATYMQLLADGNSDPTMRAILANPENQNLAKRLIGLQELTIPDASSWNKQQTEINLLLEEPPPPPTVPPPIQVPNPMTPDIMETIQPPPVQDSSIPIDKDYDNHAAEFLTVVLWINSPKGQKAKKEKPDGFENVRLHGLSHKQALAASMPPAPPAVPPVPPAGHSGSVPHAAPKPPAGAPPAPPAPPSA